MVEPSFETVDARKFVQLSRTARISELFEQMGAIVERRGWNRHPFDKGVNLSNVEKLLGNYLAMSESFPYIQAGANSGLIADHIAHGEDVPEATRITAVVSAFLCWDEFGGHAKLLSGGITALPEILDTRNFHALLLRDDLKKIFGHEILPRYSPITRAYLQALGHGLGSVNSIERVAHMVAFEHHAGVMITSLWAALKAIYNLCDLSLTYFETHVGGDAPGEAFHVAMTARMVEHIVEVGDEPHFLEMFEEAYALNTSWCDAIK